MLTRILTGACLLLAAIPIVCFAHTFVLVAVCALLGMIGVYEMFRCLGLHKNPALAIPSYLLAVILPGVTRYFLDRAGTSLLFFAVIYLYTLYMLAACMFSRGNIRFADAAKAITSAAYILCGFSSLVAICDLKHGKFLLVMAVAIAFTTDIFAYFSGMLFGRHKLIPAVSPKKTVEGAIGGTLISAVAFLGAAFLYAYIYDAGRPAVLPLFLCGVALSVVSQIGDLVASYIKRESEIKDYGTLFPGHGGVLDRFDSVIAVAPVLLLLLANPTTLSIFR